MQNLPSTESRRTSSYERAQRYAYTSRVRLLLGFDPWCLAIALDGVDLSSTGVQCLLPWKNSPLTREEADALVVPGDPYRLQLEHSFDHLAAPMVPSRLVRRQLGSTGMELAFHFDDIHQDVLSLIHELQA